MGINGANSPWTPAALELLETLAGLEENLTYREIAERMTAQCGVTFTKNSCIGRGRRMGLPPRPPREDPPECRQLPANVAAPIAPVIPRPRNGREINIYQLRDSDCHWPAGDRPPLTYCGRPAWGGSPYCFKHHKEAHGR